MGTITSGIGLASGIDTNSLIEQLLALESIGKTRLQQRVAVLKTQQTALLDINARLLNFKTAAGAFRVNKTFQSVLAKSGNEDVLTASASTAAQPGSYSFIVRQLVSKSQVMSRGFADADTTPLNMDQFTVELGNGRLQRDRSIEELNGGQGIDRGEIEITDRAGNSATIDLTDVTTINEVLDRINGASGIGVTARAQGDHFVLEDTSGGAGTLTVENGLGDTTATDLGIAGTGTAGTLTGTSVFYLTSDTKLASLNDGNGVLIRNSVPDLSVTLRDGTEFNIDLGRVDRDIDDSTLLEDLNDGAGITIDSDSDSPELKFVDRSGAEHEIDLTGVTTVGGLRSRISSQSGGAITLEVVGGDKFRVVDNTGATDSNLKVVSAGNDDGEAAEELGILNEDGVDAASFEGEVVPTVIDQPAVTTLGEVIDRINNALDTLGGANAGRLVASIAADGQRLQIEDASGGAGDLTIEATTGNPDFVADLGLGDPPTGQSTFEGKRLIGGLDSVLLSSLNGGSGLAAGAGTLTITDRAGNTANVTGLDQYETLEELISAVNADLVGQGVDVSLAISQNGTALDVTDSSGATASNLVIAGDLAASLGIESDVADDSVRGTNLQLQYVSNATRLSDLNYGRGIGTGSFRIRDGLGNEASITVNNANETVYDLIQRINSRGLAIKARVNDQGDGVIIEEDLTDFSGQSPFTTIRVSAESGSSARDLGLLGEAEDIEGGFIDGSYEKVIDLNTSDTLEELVEKLNDADIPVSATIVNTGGGATPYRLSLTSDIAGTAGRLVLDTGGVDLGLAVTRKGDDAKVFFGDDEESGLLVTSSTNTLRGVVQGVTIDLLQASDEPVELTIERDTEGIVEAVQQFVTTFNDVIGAINKYDFYDVDSEEKGVLLGNGTTSQVESALYRIATGSARNVDGSFRFLTQVGIGINSKGELTLDQEKFREAYESDPESVEALFAAYEEAETGDTQVVDGVTVANDDQEFTSLGFGNLFDQLLENLTDSIDGVMTRADEAVTDQIDLLNDRIARFDERLEARRLQLQREFTAMEVAISQLQSQATALSQIQAIQPISGRAGIG